MSVEVTTPTLVRWGIGQLLLDLRATPQTSLAAPAHVGDVSVTVTDVDPFEAGGLWSPYDYVGEADAVIAEDWDETSPVLPLTFKGRPAGLQFEHAQGSPCGSGLYLYTPNNVDHMVKKDHTLIFLTISTASRVGISLNQLEPDFKVGIEVRLPGVQTRPIGPDDELMDPNQWTFEQQQKMDELTWDIAQVFLTHWTIMTSIGEIAIGQGDPLNPSGTFWETIFTPIVVNTESGAVLQYRAQGQLIVRGKRLTIDK